MTTSLKLPHERDQSTDNTASQPHAEMKQARKDLEAGQVDTDMRASPGLDAAQRKRYVPGAGGQGPPTETEGRSAPTRRTRRGG